MGAFCRLLLCGLAVAIAGCGNKGPGTGPAAAGRVPLTELGMETYKGFGGGLYPAGGNVEPTAHAAAGQSRAQAVTPLATSGTPTAGGKVVLLSLGMSNTTQEFCSGSSTTTNCSSWSFMGQAAADPTVNHTTLAIVNGARGGQDAQAWDAATDANYAPVVARTRKRGMPPLTPITLPSGSTDWVRWGSLSARSRLSGSNRPTLDRATHWRPHSRMRTSSSRGSATSRGRSGHIIRT